MGAIFDAYLRDLEARLAIRGEKKRQILDEIRGHLQERAEALCASDPVLALPDVERIVAQEFGSPQDLALAYEDDTPVLKKHGETVLRFGRAVGRGTKSVVKWTAIGFAGALVLASALGVWAYYEFKPVIARNVPYSVYSHYESCEAKNCTDTAVEQRFFVHGGAREVRLEVSSWLKDGGFGSVRVTVLDPAGEKVFARTFAATSGDYVREATTLAPVTGNWTIVYDFAGYRGSLDVDVETVGLPLGALA